MPLKEVVQKRDKLRDHRHAPTPEPSSALPVPEIRFVRSDNTTSQEAVDPHGNEEDDNATRPGSPEGGSSPSPSRSRLSLFHHRSRSLSASTTSTSRSHTNSHSPPARPRGERRLSQLLHLNRGGTSSRNSSRSSLSANVNVPADLPQINNDGAVDEQDREAQWEKRATLLVQRNPRFGDNLSSGCTSSNVGADGRPGSRSSSPGRVNDPEGDVCLDPSVLCYSGFGA
jgi:hypothetical protein